MIILSPFCGDPSCESSIKDQSTRKDTDAVAEFGISQMGAKTLCIPFDQPRIALPEKCINPECSRSAKFFALFGRSY